MRTAVCEGVYFAIAMPGNDNRTVADMSGDEVACVRDLAFMGDIKPCMAEYPFHFGGEHIGIGIDAAVYPAVMRQV